MYHIIDTSKDTFQNIITKLITDAHLTHLVPNSKYDIVIQEMRKRDWREECKPEISHILDEIERLGKLLENPTLSKNDQGTLHLEICDLNTTIYARLPADLFSPIPITIWKR